jgi:ATPase subunit of ABC transporter with duplicated ATPase domains|tara:strand:+ start:740 stop:2686 length:1947 start_codon:yes stop_codon:yes gene_type:complete
MISVSNLAKSFGDRTLFEAASFQLNNGDRCGLVGANGSGKTTLLNILSGSEEASSGSVSIPKDASIGILKQDHYLFEDQQILSVALMGNRELWDAMQEKEQLLARAEESFDEDRFSELEDTVQRYDGYAAEVRAATVLEGLGLPEDLHGQPLSTLSGGFKLRVLLAQALAASPDVLLLDEPTNHLDILSIRWLEKFLTDFFGPVVVISHDHRFLDNVSTNILDVDYQTVLGYRGNYSQFLEAKSTERTRREKQIETRAREIAQHQTFVDRFRAKASKARQAQSKLRLIEKKAGELEALPGSSRRYPTFRFEPRRSSGREVLKIKNVHKAFGDNSVLRGIDLLVERGDRIAIMGPNGIGKSTLLQIAMGDTEADAGEITWGYETQVGYFAQDHRTQLGEERQTAENWLWTFCPGRDRGFVRGQMGLMLFSGDDGKKRLSALSGGEVARLIFSRLSLEEPNVLVLDEPTNHLDMESIEALVEELKVFQGTLILVSHDRWFVSQLATRIVEITSEYVKDYPGTYEEYVRQSGDDHLDVDTVVLKARKEKRKRQGKSGQKSRAQVAAGEVPDIKRLERQREKLTRAIEAGETRIAEIDDLFCEPEYFKRTKDAEVSRLEKERIRLLADIQGLLEEWEDVEKKLDELVGQDSV